MRFELKRLGVWSTVKIGFLVWGLIGFIAGLYMALMMPFIFSVLGSFGGFPADAEAMTPIALILLPFMYSLMSAVVGTVLTAIVAAFYNGVSHLIGGIEVDLHAEKVYPPGTSSESVPHRHDDEAHSV